MWKQNKAKQNNNNNNNNNNRKWESGLHVYEQQKFRQDCTYAQARPEDLLIAYMIITLDKVLYSTKTYIFFFLFLDENICCGTH